MMSTNDLSTKHCKACEGGVPALADRQARELLATLPGWELAGGEIAKTYRFKNYYQTIAFVNATAWISNQENHHPDLEVGYNKCKVRYSTHSIGVARWLARTIVNHAVFDQHIQGIGALWCLCRTNAWRDQHCRDDQCGH